MKIKIIAINGKPRNIELTKLRNHEIAFAVDGRGDSFEIPEIINQESNLIFLGHVLSGSQSAAVLSHFQAQKPSNLEWMCILEDDAVVIDTEMFYEALEAIEKLKIKKPTIIKLYTGFGGTYGKSLKINRNFAIMKNLAPSTGAVGYAINHAASILIADQTSLVGTPDWPSWSARTDFYTLVPEIISHDPKIASFYTHNIGKDFITSWPLHRTNIFQSFRGVMDKDIIAAYGGLLNYYQINIKTRISRFLSYILSRIFLR